MSSHEYDLFTPISLLKIMGKCQSHGQNKAQHLCYMSEKQREREREEKRAREAFFYLVMGHVQIIGQTQVTAIYRIL